MINKTGIEEISFGTGGGFTGKVSTYILQANGRLYKEGNEFKKIGSKETLEIFNEAKAVKEYTFNEPGNLYSFIEIKSKGKENRIVWEYGSTKVDVAVIELNDKLSLLIK